MAHMPVSVASTSARPRVPMLNQAAKAAAVTSKDAAVSGCRPRR
jgi:hypothetical protein